MAELIFHVATGTRSVKRRLAPRGGRDGGGTVLYLGYARQVTGEVLHADGGAHAGRW